MKIKSGESGIEMIKPTLFYSSVSEKTKLNWFCYEISMGFYDKIKEKLGKKLTKNKIDE